MFVLFITAAFVITCLCLLILAEMRSFAFSLLLSGLSLVSSQCNSSTPSLAWYAPRNTSVNTLSSVVNSTGTYGFIFNGSTDPVGVEYGTYNWCNMPHVRPQEYVKAADGYQLEYVEVVCQITWCLTGLKIFDTKAYTRGTI